MDNYILELHNISKSFPGVKALDDINLKIKIAIKTSNSDTTIEITFSVNEDI